MSAQTLWETKFRRSLRKPEERQQWAEYLVGALLKADQSAPLVASAFVQVCRELDLAKAAAIANQPAVRS